MNVPSIFPRPCHVGAGRCPVVFSKLSKLLNQESALSAPCFASTAWEGVSVAFDFRLRFAIYSADEFLVVGGKCTGRAPMHGQAVPLDKPALTYESLLLN